MDNGDGLSARELLDTMCTGASASASTKSSTVASKSSDKAAKKSKSNSEKATKESTAVATEVVTAATMDPSTIKDKRSCCCYNRAFIEHISLLLDEPGALEEIRDQLLGEGECVAKSPLAAILYTTHRMLIY